MVFQVVFQENADLNFRKFFSQTYLQHDFPLTVEKKAEDEEVFSLQVGC